jgi:2-C-methyl-D-erythritol 4-phosphate cytidylyltransferase
MRNTVIIVAGGLGIRMGSVLPKQFLEVNNKPLIIYTLEKFLNYDPAIEIILVLNEKFFEYWERIQLDSGFHYPVKLAFGGKTRFHSVKSGIEKIEEESLIGIHDSVRPLISVDTIARVYSAAEKYGCAIPCIPLKESVRETNGDKSHPLNRSFISVVQTPQVFRSEILKIAYKTNYQNVFTDDASVVEYAGYEIKLVEGDEYNLKITTPEDFEIAKILLTLQKPPLH